MSLLVLDKELFSDHDKLEHAIQSLGLISEIRSERRFNSYGIQEGFNINLISKLFGSLLLHHGAGQLTSIDLCDANIGSSGCIEMCKSLSILTSVRVLQLGNNNIGSSGCAALCRVLPYLGNLNSLHLKNNNIGTSGCIALCTILSRLHNLKSLDLENNKIGLGACASLSSEMRSATALMELNLGKNDFGDVGNRILCCMLSSLVSLGTLALNQSYISPCGAGFQLSCLTNLRVLHFENNRTGGGLSHCSWLYHHLSQLTKMKFLHLNGNNIGSRECATLCEALPFLTNLKYLDLSQNMLGRTGAESLGHTLSSLHKLTFLDLHNNGIGEVGCGAISGVLHHLTNLSELSIGFNNIGPSGCTTLCDSLGRLPKLKTLVLPSNGIGKEGIKAVCTVLATAALSTLELDGNSIGPSGCTSICNVLTCLTNLQNLRLGYNNIRQDGCNSLCNVLSLLTNLEFLELTSNHIKEAAKKAMAHQLIQMVYHGAALKQVIGIPFCSAACEFDFLPSEADDWKNDAIVEYIRDLKSSGVQEVKRVNIMLIGPGTAGKTTLIHRIRHGKFKHDFQFTDGVDVSEWTTNYQNLQVQAWDFGGQDIYFTTHPMFFSNKSIYLLVWNPRITRTVSMREYIWTIRSRAASAPIIIVCTHSDEEGSNIDSSMLNQLRCEFNNMISDQVHYVSSKTGEGIEHLLNHIYSLALSESMPYVQQKIPQSYSRLLDKLKAIALSLDGKMVVPYVSLKEVRNMGLSREIGMREIEEVDRALSLFHDWGVIIHVRAAQGEEGNEDFQQDPASWNLSQIVFLQPSKLTELFSSVVSWKNKTKGRIVNGILNHCDCAEIWADCDPKLHKAFISLLHHFEIGYQLEKDPKTAAADSNNNNNNSFEQTLIPNMLEAAIPEAAEAIMSKFNNNNNNNKSEPPRAVVFGSEYELSFVPPDFAHRLIVRCQDLNIKGGWWRNGCAVKLGSNSHGVIEICNDQKIKIKVIAVHGAGKRLFEILCGRLKSLLNGSEYANDVIKLTKKSLMCSRLHCGEMKSEKIVMRCIEQGKESLKCEGCDCNIDMEYMSIGMLMDLNARGGGGQKNAALKVFDNKISKLTCDAVDDEERRFIERRFCELMRPISNKNRNLKMTNDRNGPCVWILQPAAPLESFANNRKMEWEAICACEGNDCWHIHHHSQIIALNDEEVMCHADYFHRVLKVCELVGLLPRDQCKKTAEQLDEFIEIMCTEMADEGNDDHVESTNKTKKIPPFAEWVHRRQRTTLPVSSSSSSFVLQAETFTKGETRWVCENHRIMPRHENAFGDGANNSGLAHRWSDHDDVNEWRNLDGVGNVGELKPESRGMEFVRKIFQAGQQSIEVSRAEAVRNGALRGQFENFASWNIQKNADGGGEKEGIFETRLEPYLSDDRTLFGWYGCSSVEAAHLVCKTGPQCTGAGGGGVHLSLRSEHAAAKYSAHVMVLCQVCVGSGELTNDEIVVEKPCQVHPIAIVYFTPKMLQSQPKRARACH